MKRERDLLPPREKLQLLSFLLQMESNYRPTPSNRLDVVDDFYFDCVVRSESEQILSLFKYSHARKG